MQDEFVRPGWTPYWVPGATSLVPGIKELIEHSRRQQIPVIFTAFADSHLGFDRPRSGTFMPNRYPETPHEPEWFRDGTIWYELEPRPEEVVIHKPSYGAFYDTPLQTILNNLGRDTIIICGTLTNFCCGTKAGIRARLQGRGRRRPYATDDPRLHEAELKTLQKGFAEILSLQDLIGATTGTPAS